MLRFGNGVDSAGGRDRKITSSAKANEERQFSPNNSMCSLPAKLGTSTSPSNSFGKLVFTREKYAKSGGNVDKAWYVAAQQFPVNYEGNRTMADTHIHNTE
jgi:hypothetical protein